MTPQSLTSLWQCRVCGCTEADCRQCIEATGQPCSWADWDLCTRCVQLSPRLIRVLGAIRNMIVAQANDEVDGRPAKCRWIMSRGLAEVLQMPKDSVRILCDQLVSLNYLEAQKHPGYANKYSPKFLKGYCLSGRNYFIAAQEAAQS